MAKLEEDAKEACEKFVREYEAARGQMGRAPFQYLHYKKWDDNRYNVFRVKVAHVLVVSSRTDVVQELLSDPPRLRPQPMPEDSSYSIRLDAVDGSSSRPAIIVLQIVLDMEIPTYGWPEFPITATSRNNKRQRMLTLVGATCLTACLS